MSDTPYGKVISSAISSLDDVDADLIRRISYRVLKMAQIKSRLIRTWRQNHELIDVYRSQQDYGEDFNQPTRFPTAFGMCRRIYSEILQAPPEVKVVSMKRTKNDMAMAQAGEEAVKHIKEITNYKNERKKVIRDMTHEYGNGIMYIGHKNMADGIKTIAFRRVDPRFFFYDETALNLHDTTDGNLGARDCYEDVLVPMSTFKKEYLGREGFRNIDKVHGVDKIVPQLGLLSMVFDSESYMNTITAGEYVQMGNYYNRETDEFAILANGIPIYNCKLTEEYPHGRLPYVQYKMYERNDIGWADGILDVTSSIIVQNDILNTMEMDNIKYSISKPTFIAGTISFDDDKQLVRPGAVIKVNGIAGGKVQDSIYQANIGAPDGVFFNARTMLSDELTLATGDDMRGLQQNPDQLATQTAYKARTLTKLLKATVMINEIDAVKTETELIIETMKSHYGDEEQMIVPVKGFKVKQSSRGNKRIPKFEKSSNTEDSFVLYPNVFDAKYRVIVEPKSVKEDEDQQAVQNTMSFLQLIMNMSQLLPDLPKRVDFYSLVYDIAERLGVNMQSVFPAIISNSVEDGEQTAIQIMQGNYPENNDNPEEQLQEMLAIRASDAYRNMSMDQKNKFDSKLKELAAMRGKQQGVSSPQTLAPNVNLQARLPAPNISPAGSMTGQSGLANQNTARTIGTNTPL